MEETYKLTLEICFVYRNNRAKPRTSSRMSDVVKGFLEVGKRNIRNAIWRFEDLTQNLKYRDFEPADLDYD